jgi:hypothetical protein
MSNMELDDTVGLFIINTLTLSDCLFMVYDLKSGTVGDLLTEFYNNYDCKSDNIKQVYLYHKCTSEYMCDLPKDKLLKDCCNTIKCNQIIVEKSKYIRLKPTYYVPTNDENPYNIFIKTITGKIFTIDNMCGNHNIMDIKSKIEQMNSTPHDTFRLIFDGKHLVDNMKLNEYNIKKHSTIHMINILRGGMYHETSGKAGNYQPLKNNIFFIKVDLKKLMKKIEN